MDRYLYIENVTNTESSDNSGEEKNMFFTKDRIDQDAIVNFANYQIAPIKADNCISLL
jgi:hypothetical protein